MGQHDETPRWVAGIVKRLDQLHLQGKHLMSAVADLQAAVVNLTTAAADEITAITAVLAGQGDSVSSADVETAVTGLNAVADNLKAETAKLTAPPVQPAARK